MASLTYATWTEESDAAEVARTTGRRLVSVDDGVLTYARELRAGETAEDAVAEFRATYDGSATVVGYAVHGDAR